MKTIRPHHKICPKCDGKGFTIYRRWGDMMFDGYDDIVEDCNYCFRYGIVLEEPKPVPSIR